MAPFSLNAALNALLSTKAFKARTRKFMESNKRKFPSKFRRASKA